VPLTPERHQ